MTWTDAPDKIEQARDAIKACAASATLGCNTDGQANYPDAGLKTTAFPFYVLEEAEYGAERVAPGRSFGRGRIVARFYLNPDAITQGQAEQACRDLVHQLMELEGEYVFLLNATRSLASRVRRSKAAAAVDGASRKFFTIEVSMEWEG